MKSYSELLIENERLRDELADTQRELRVTREGNPTFSDLRSQIEVQAEQLAELRDAAERVCTEAGEYRDSEHDLPTWGATEDSLSNLAAVLASTEGGE